MFVFNCCMQKTCIQSPDFSTQSAIYRNIPHLQVRGNKTQSITELIKNVETYFIDTISKRKPTIWAILHKQIFNQNQKQLKQKLFITFEKMKEEIQLSIQHPVYDNCQDIIKLQQQNQVKVVVDQNMFDEAMKNLHHFQNVIAFYVISPQSYQIAKDAFDYSKVRQLHSSYDQIIKIILNQSHKIAVLIKKADIRTGNKGFRYEVMFPNFLRINKHQKSHMRNYRINIYALTTLTQQQKISSKKKFCQYAINLYQQQPQKLADIQNYGIHTHSDQWILIEYTKDTYFYRVINSTLRMAQNTQEFFVIGQPFNRLFNAIKTMYQQQQAKKFQEQQIQQRKVYRKVRLSNQESQYLRNHVGSYIQILGFISTSKSQNLALTFGDDKNMKQVKPQIIQFILKQPFKDLNQKYTYLDYGYVDLQQRNLTVHPQQEQVLINSMNIFKIKEVKTKIKYGKQYQYIVLQYGAIFDLLGKQSQDLSDVERRTLADYLSLQQLALQVNNIGQAYLKNNKWKQAFDYFRAVASKCTDFEQKTQATLKSAQALQNGFQVDKALEMYSHGLKTLLQENNKLQQKQKTRQSLSQTQMKIKLFAQKKVADVSNRLVRTYLSVDNFQQAQKASKDMENMILKSIVNVNEIQNMKKMAEIKQNIGYSKSLQEQSFQQRTNLQFANTIYEEIESTQNLSTNDEMQILLKRSQVVQKYANSQFKNPPSQQKGKMNELINSFDNVSNKLKRYVSQGSYQYSVLKRRQLQIKAQNLILKIKKGNSQKQKSIKSTHGSFASLKSIQSQTLSNLTLITKQVGQVDQQVIKNLKLISMIESSQQIPTLNNYLNAVNFQQKASRTSILLYSKYDHKSVQSLNDLALLHSQYSNHDKGIQILKSVSQTSVNRKGSIHTSIAKTYYNMGKLYYEKGQLHKAMSAFDQSLDIFEKSLTPKRFTQSVFRYRVNLQRGMILIDRAEPRAQTLLMEYREYTQKFEQKDQSTPEVGRSYNVLGVFYLKQRQSQTGIKNFLKAEQQFKKYGGQKFIQLGKIKCNLAICKASLGTNTIKQSEEELLTKGQNIFKHNIKQNYDIHPFRAKIYWYHGQLCWIRDQYLKAIQYYNKSIQITKKYEWHCKLNEFVCRYKIAQCMRQMLNIDKKGKLQDLQKYVYQLMEDIQKDLAQTEGYDRNDKNKKVKTSDNKKYKILKKIYELLDVDQAQKIIDQ